MRCSICRDPGHTKAKCGREDLKLLHQIRDLAARHARSRQRAELRGPPQDWHPDLEVYLDDDTEELEADERERAVQMATLLQAWRDAGGVLQEIQGGRDPLSITAPAAPLLQRRPPDRCEHPASWRVVEVRAARWTPLLRDKLIELRDEMAEAYWSRDPATRKAFRCLATAWRRSPQAALWRWEQHYHKEWPTSAAKASLDAPAAADSPPA